MSRKVEWGSVLLVEDDEAQRAVLTRWLEKHGHEVHAYESGEGALRGLAETVPDAICLDLHLPGMSGLATLEAIKVRNPRLPVIMLTSDDTVEAVVSAIRLGAFEYLPKPTTETKLLTTVNNAIRQGRMAVRLIQLQHEISGWHYPDIVGGSDAMKRLFREMDRVSLTDVRVLIRGESGTGKELVAKALHEASGRAAKPMRAVNCAAIAESLQESEMFGHEKGAFTGASRLHRGHFELADGGTLFLDEVGELPPSLQANLLRVLEERRFLRVGGTDYVESDFRLIAATNRDLAAEAAEGRFRQDLYFRIAVFELAVPPLRDRGADVELLANTFARGFGEAIHGKPAELSREAATEIRAYAWPGNVRELQNAIHRACVVALDGTIMPEHLPDLVRGGASWSPPMGDGPASLDTASEPDRGSEPGSAPGGAPPAPGMESHGSWERLLPDVTLSELEGAAVRAALVRHGGNLSAVARALGISRTTLYRKMSLHEIARG